MANLADISKIPVPSKERGQRSIPISEAYFARIIPSWSQPNELTPDMWRWWVKQQPIAVACKETMTSNISDLDWKITPRESDQRDELKGTIKHYERLLQQGGGGMDWLTFLEWTLSDLLDLPFGSAWEVGRKGDSPDGRVMWLEPIDGGTLYPTNNKDYPVYQYFNGYSATFPAYAIARTYMTPRTEIERKGWGMAPPERIFLAMEMLSRGDKYYANLLLDIPPVGVFDLGDITWEDANTWINSFRTAVTGVGSADSFKIPVLAEHTGKVDFIPLGKTPNDIMYDRITLKYASLVCAGYGMSLSDIGVQSASASGQTLAGGIRDEQKTNRTGKARVKAKLKYMIESFLPDTLQFDFIDTDGERLAMLGRARLANATAMNQYREMEAISPEEARLQAIQDGLFTISMPEKPPKEAKKPIQAQPFGKPVGNKPPERPASVGSPQPPSLGGDGEVKKTLPSLPNLDDIVQRSVMVLSPVLQEIYGSVEDVETTKSLVENSVFLDDEYGLGKSLDSLINLEDKELSAFLGRSIVYNLLRADLNDANTENLISDIQARVSASVEDYLAHLGDSNG